MSTNKKPVVRYNVELPNIKAYVSGVVTLRGVASVHVRLGEVMHVVFAESAIALGESLIEQGRAAQVLAEAWTRALENQTEIDDKAVTP